MTRLEARQRQASERPSTPGWCLCCERRGLFGWPPVEEEDPMCVRAYQRGLSDRATLLRLDRYQVKET